MRLPLLALTLTVLALLVACVPAPGRFRPDVTVAPVDAPLFASDAEALAAAEEVYREYIDVSGSVDTPKDLERLEEYATERWLAKELETRLDLEQRGIRSDGDPSIRWLKLQEMGESGLTFYACLELDRTRVIDAQGNDVTPSQREPEGLLLVTLVKGSERFLVDWSELWSNSCS